MSDDDFTVLLSEREVLEILLLLSALESWGFSTTPMIPDYLHERLASTIQSLSDKLVTVE